jgi:hypothetical protein
MLHLDEFKNPAQMLDIFYLRQDSIRRLDFFCDMALRYWFISFDILIGALYP